MEIRGETDKTEEDKYKEKEDGKRRAVEKAEGQGGQR